jgi:hypothetical protein
MARNKCNTNGDAIQYQCTTEDEQIQDGKMVSEDYKNSNNELFIQYIEQDITTTNCGLHAILQMAGLQGMTNRVWEPYMPRDMNETRLNKMKHWRR